MPSSNPLPPKENAQFKRILKCYEQKQYKNGLKFAKQILSNPKFQEHGETLAMKGLTLNCLGRKEEAYDYVRRGLRNDLKSHVCWHVFGLLQRSDKKYDEAIKCYRNALKWDSENIQILRDLSLLQIQMRDLEGYKETRYQLFHLRPTQRASWIGFAMSYHLLKDYEMALKIIEEFRKTQQKAAYDYEHSELLLYQNLVIQESGDPQAALEHLDKYQDQICDKVTLLETKGKNFLSSKKLSEAEAVYRDLISRNPENHDYYHKLIEAIEADTSEKKLAVYTEYKEKFPKAQVPQRLPLDVAEGETFRQLVDAYLRKSLTKGVPPLFVDLRPLYSDPSKVQIIEELCHSYQKWLKDEDAFEEDGEKQPATASLWLLYYLSQHYDYKNDYEKALGLVNQALDHTPTLIELFLLKGKIHKHLGNMEEAVANMDEAQSLDTADRYINCKCAKYLLRANRVREAEEMCQKFTREGVSAMENLNEMQCMWFQTECALAYERLGKYGDSLKKCIEVDRHFTEIIEDQFDFHTYCMRKMTLRSYVDLLRLEDVLRTHRFYKRAAHCAIGVYLRLHDYPLKDAGNLDELNTENMDPSELKKLRNKQKKAKKKAELERQSQQQAQARKELHNRAQKKGNDEEVDSPSKDELVPEKLERPENPLSEALKFLTPLCLLAPKDLKTHLFAFEIYYRKAKPLLMMQSIKRALNVDPANPRVHGCVARLHHFIGQNRAKISAPVMAVLEKNTHELFNSKSAVEFNDEFIQKGGNDLQHVIVGARIMALMDPSNLDQAVKMVTKLDKSVTGATLNLCLEVLDSLKRGDFGVMGKNAVTAYRQSCERFFKHSSIFREPPAGTETSKTAHNNGKVVQVESAHSNPSVAVN